jgi:hypothetical protein
MELSLTRNIYFKLLNHFVVRVSIPICPRISYGVIHVKPLRGSEEHSAKKMADAITKETVLS